jgi:hypothetical protein
VLAPGSATITAGGSQSYTATGFDSQGNAAGTVTSTTTFDVDGNTSLCSTATCSPTTAGNHTVRGTNGTATGTATLKVIPGASDTGVPAGTRLTVHDGDLTIATAGTVVDGLDIHGFVTVTALGVTIKNSIIRGAATTTERPLLLSASATASVTIQDSELSPAVPSGWIDGIRGWNITAQRVNIHQVIDGFHIYGNNVTIESSWLHDNLHLAVDPNQNGGPSHDDGIEIRVGTNIRITGNNMSGAFNAAVQLAQDLGIVSDVQIVDNWLDGGGCTINVSEKNRGPFQGLFMTDNTFGRNTRLVSCPIIAPRTTVIDLARNFYTDGAIVTVRPGA